MSRSSSILGDSTPALFAVLWALLALPSLAIAADQPPIFKCTDSAGNITYQNEPCPKNSKSGKIEIFDNRWTATREEREAEWRRNAAEHHLATGMPARWVREALGEPTEIRDTPTGGAAQLWLYNLRDRSVQVGMLNDQVLWFRETPVSSPAARIAPPAERPSTETARSSALAAPSPSRPADLPVMRMVPTEADRIAEARPSTQVSERPTAETRSAPTEAGAPGAAVATTPTTGAPPTSGATAASTAAASAPGTAKTPRAVARGQDCKQALADLGPPDRQRDVPALDAGSDPAIEYFYESATTGRLRIVCANGKVEGVDRTVGR